MTDNAKINVHTQVRDFSELILEFFRTANTGADRVGFLRKASAVLVEFTGADSVELRLEDGELHYRWEYRAKDFFEKVEIFSSAEKSFVDLSLGAETVHNKITPSISTERQSYIIFDNQCALFAEPDETFSTVAVIPFSVSDRDRGTLVLKSKKMFFFGKHELETFEHIAANLGIAIATRRAMFAFRERLKEMTCLYGISQLAQNPEVPLNDVLRDIVELIPPAWQYPELARARIVFDDKMFATRKFRETRIKLSAPIVLNSIERGNVEIFYTKPPTRLETRPFLREEEVLIKTIAQQLSLIIERRLSYSEREKLQLQLRHADRLATIGQLAAGVAHELNEPLANILGFAQLVQMEKKLPQTIASDVAKIVSASLHAREVVKKLLIFARQVPTKKTEADLNKIIEDGMFFLLSRCVREGIEVNMQLNNDLPRIIADASQINQVLINLVVNAIQAMEAGGTLTIRTYHANDMVFLSVEDTGSGMTEEIRKQIFLPFFTTKDVGQGTGLGLAVVHGIVSAHGGTITVDTKLGEGTKFEVAFPATN